MGYLKDNGIEAVCFDIDGTLYPKWQTNVRLVIAAMPNPFFSFSYLRMRTRLREKNGYDGGEESGRKGFLEKECIDLYGKIDGAHLEKLERKERKVFYDRWDFLFRSITPFPHVRESLLAIKKEARIAFLSDFPIGVKLDALGVTDIPEFAVSTEDIGALKPSRVPFLYLSRLLGVENDRILYVGDSERKDVLGAKNVGMHTLLISRRKKESNADLVVSSYKEMCRFLL